MGTVRKVNKEWEKKIEVDGFEHGADKLVALSEGECKLELKKIFLV